MDCDKGEDYGLFRSSVDRTPNVQELNTYNDLVVNMMGYFEELRERVRRILESEGGLGKDDDIGEDVLQDELISRTLELLHQLMKLELFWVLEYSFDKSSKANNLLSQLIETLLYIFQYEKFELKFVKAHNNSWKENVKQALIRKNAKNQLSLSIPFGLGGKKTVEEEGEEGKSDGQVMNEQHLYSNSVMRGYLKFMNGLQSYNYMDPGVVENEMKVKLQICEILERYLDMRQNFMI